MSERFLVVASFPDSILAFRGHLLRALRDRGFEVHVAAPGLGVESDVRSQLEDCGCRVHDLPMERTGLNPVRDLALLGRLVWLLGAVRPKIAMAYTAKPVIYLGMAIRLRPGCHFYPLITGLGSAISGERPGLLGSLLKGLYRTSLASARRVMFQNPDDQQFFRSARLIRKNAPTALMNGSGVDLHAFEVAPLPPTVTFLMIGRLIVDKGIREYFEACRIVRECRPSVRTLLVGWLDSNPTSLDRSELEEQLALSGVEFLGRLSDVRPAIAEASVFVLPSYREGTPRTVLEAMAMGRAIITTDVPGCRETVIPGETGLLVKPRSSAELASAMLALVDDPVLVARMGRASRRYAEAKYDVGDVNLAMMKAMEIESTKPEAATPWMR